MRVQPTLAKLIDEFVEDGVIAAVLERAASADDFVIRDQSAILKSASHAPSVRILGRSRW